MRPHCSTSFWFGLIYFVLFCLVSLLLDDDDDDVDVPHSKLHCGQKSWTSPPLHPLPPPDSPSKPSHSPSWLRLPNKFPGNFFSSTPVPLSAACSLFLFFLSFLNLFIFPVWRAPCLTALPPPSFFIVSFGRTGDRPSVNGVADDIAVIRSFVRPSVRMRL
jgi:hypothetical protein